MATKKQRAEEQVAAAARLTAAFLGAPTEEQVRAATEEAIAAAKEAGLSDAVIQSIVFEVEEEYDGLIGALARSRARGG